VFARSVSLTVRSDLTGRYPSSRRDESDGHSGDCAMVILVGGQSNAELEVPSGASDGETRRSHPRRASPPNESPRLCRGGSRSLTVPAVRLFWPSGVRCDRYRERGARRVFCSAAIWPLLRGQQPESLRSAGVSLPEKSEHLVCVGAGGVCAVGDPWVPGAFLRHGAGQLQTHIEWIGHVRMPHAALERQRVLRDERSGGVSNLIGPGLLVLRRSSSSLR
jgi:hypothetical protein